MTTTTADHAVIEWENQSKLYEAYNELHGLAQEFETPFDAPAVLVVGHQTDGKSALVEALMGFQFNHVGGGTKTRRPITLHMKFNPECDEPVCWLISETDSCVSIEKSLQQVQEYIEAENMRLERETCQFSSKEIIVRVEYKYCPNLTIIDTPGLEFIVLCLEDCNDWSNATTRRVVMQIDPELSRTVVVSTKLDTKIPQFARASDVEVFLAPPASVLDGFMLGDSPFFTSVPSGRVGSGHESVYRSNDEFKQAISLREMEDVASLEEKLGRSLSKQERSRIGLSLLLKGTVVAPPDKFGETLQDERVNGGALTGIDGSQFPLKLIPNAGMRLYGGAQYHRAMAEFRFVVGGIKCPPITREEIVNACGVEDIHDGTNYSRTACVIAVAKARDTFEPFLHQLGSRLLHILKRLLPISVYLLQKEGEFLSGHEVFLRRVSTAFNNFAESTERSCIEKCMEDLISTTRYVTWSLHNKNRAGLRQFLDSFGGAEQPGTDSSTSVQTTETRLADLLDSTLWNRRLAPSSERIVYALVQQIFHGIREYFLASAELKFNCFFLMPVVDKLPALLREDLESAFEDDLDNVFDITNLRHALGQRKRETEIEMKRIQRLKDEFRKIHEQLSLHQVIIYDHDSIIILCINTQQQHEECDLMHNSNTFEP
nr:dynamin-like protein ARC5 isoform X2 [Tanacetum cinerariifolium]